jgi:acyl-CoA synthetase (AMP-forming)/AMP-acid ligase II
MGAVGIETSDLSTVVEVLDRAAEVNGPIEAYVEPSVDGSPRRSLTFAEWKRAADRTSSWIRDLGVEPDDVVCVVLGPGIDFAVAYQAILRAGAITSGINPRMGAVEQASIFERIRPVLTIVEDDADLEESEVTGRIVTRSSLSGVIVDDDRLGDAPVRRISTDPVAVVWTSGTTGAPKGALFDHRALKAVADGTDVLSQPGDRRLSPLPFSHVSYVTRAWDEIAHGVTTVISPAPWSASSALATLEAESVTVAQGVPTQWALILELPELAEADLSSLRVAGTGAARMSPAHVAALRERLGVPVIVRYTSTETSLGTGTRPGDPDEVVATSVGRPVSGVEMVLVDDEGMPTPQGDVGRVRLRSGAVMLGYVASRVGLKRGSPPPIDTDLTSTVIDASGWVTTGDFGVLDEAGNLTLVGRDNEMFQRGGYNVYPAEVERSIDGIEGVAAVAVVAGDDPVLGEVGVAFVVLRDRAIDVTLDELRCHVMTELADYKAPDVLVVLDELPLTPMGKVDKRHLRPLADDAARRRSEALRERRR